MKEFLKKRLALVLAMLMVVTMLPISTLQVSANELPDVKVEPQQEEVKVGDNAVATYDSATKTIYVKGAGKLYSGSGTEVLEKFKDAVSLEIGDGITEIGSYCFLPHSSEYAKIVNLKLADSVKKIDYAGFRGFNDLEKYSMASDCDIDESAFSSKKLVDKNGFLIVNNIVQDYVNDNENVDTITIPEGVTKICGEVFDYDCDVNKVILPSTLKSLDRNDFSLHALQKLENITVSEKNPYYKSIDGVLYSKDGEKLIQYPVAKSGKSYTVGSGVTTIAYGAFDFCENLSSVEIGKDVKKIESHGLELNPVSNSYTVKFTGNAPELPNWMLTYDKNVDIFYPSNMSGWTNDVLNKKNNYGAGMISWIPYTVDNSIENVTPVNAPKNATGVYQGSDKKWYYFKNGKVDTSCVDVIQNPNGWWAVKGGLVDFKFNGIASNNYGDWYCQNSKVNFKANGVLKTSQGWYYFKDGKVQKGAETVQKNEYGWWYIGTDGKVDFDKNTVAKNDYGWWAIQEGKVNFKYNGLAYNDNGRWYCKNGQVDFKANGVLSTPDGWYYIKGGKVQTGAETVQKNCYGWWYIGYDGKVDFDVETVAKNDYGWWVIQGGKVNFNFNGIAANLNGEWYCKNGKVDFKYTGTYKYNDITCNIKEGEVIGIV